MGADCGLTVQGNLLYPPKVDFTVWRFLRAHELEGREAQSGAMEALDDSRLFRALAELERGQLLHPLWSALPEDVSREFA